MLVKTYAGAVQGVGSIPITIEVNVGGNILPSKIPYHLFGRPDSAGKDGQQRYESALHSNGKRMPNQKSVVNMSPANIRKEGSSYDLPIAAAILASSTQMRPDALGNDLSMGELALDGQIRP